jgi:hypothetical protein
MLLLTNVTAGRLRRKAGRAKAVWRVVFIAESRAFDLETQPAPTPYTQKEEKAALDTSTGAM